jgi:hypothetical protein
MTRLLGATVVATLVSAGTGLAARPAVAAELCVGGPGCFATIQAAVDAAQDGDTIHIGAGTFAGGIIIDSSVSLVGVSAAATRIEGGGPVITIGEALTSDPPNVSIRGVTITGGFNDSKPESPDGPGFFAAGGGVLIPAGTGFSTGATVSITDSVITGNRVTAGPPQPVCRLPAGPADGVPCSFASGGGIANWGTLTVTNTRIAGNIAGATEKSGSLATDARGGGIWNAGEGTVTLRHSWVTANRSAVTAPNGRWAEGGGVGDDGTLTIENSVVSGNHADARTAVPSMFPFDIQQEAVGGGIRITELPGATATITRSAISHNSVTSANVGGDAQATSGGIDVDGPLVLVDSTVDRNTVRASVPPESEKLAGAVFGGIEVSAAATIRGSSISGNVLTASSANGATNVAGGGIGNLSGHVTLERTLVIGNRATADGATGLAGGGGIVNIDFGDGLPELSLSHSVVTGNRLTATPGITPQGGGIFTVDLFFTGEPIPITRTRTIVAGNKPDQCFGC